MTDTALCLPLHGRPSIPQEMKIDKKVLKKSKTKCFNLLFFPHLLAGTTSPNVIKQLLLIVKQQVRPDDGLIGD